MLSFLDYTPSLSSSSARNPLLFAGLVACLVVLRFAFLSPFIVSDEGMRRYTDIFQRDVVSSDGRCQKFLQAGPGGTRHVAISPSEQSPLGLDIVSTIDGPQRPLLQSAVDLIHFVSFDAQLQDLASVCAIEAAAHANPRAQVFVHSLNATHVSSLLGERWNSSWSSKWLRSRVDVVPIVWEDAFESTPFERWYSQREWMNSSWPQQNLGNALRLALLYKKGGTYFDLDLVSVNPFPAQVKRAIGRQDKHTLNNAALKFPKGDMFLWTAMQEFVADYHGHVWGWQGPVLFSRTLATFCPELQSKIKLVQFTSGLTPRPSEIDSTSLCQSLSIVNSERFYPIQFADRHELDRPWWDACDSLATIERESIGVHMWNRYAILEKVEHTQGQLSLREKILQRSCPITNPFGLY